MAGQMVPEEIVQLCKIMACTYIRAIPSVCADFAFACSFVRAIPVVVLVFVLILLVFALVLVTE